MTGDRLRVFIVEDEVLLQMQLEMYLEEAGHSVVGIAAFSREALAQAPSAGADIALVDVHLADGPTGVEVGRKLSDQGLPVVFLTANAARLPADFSGAIGVIGKPYTQTALAETLDFLVAAVRNPPPSRPVPDALTLAPALSTRWHIN
jgi:DNA-binding response OmpR family regulator